MSALVHRAVQVKTGIFIRFMPGARTEFQFCPTPPRNGSEAEAAMHPVLEHALHLALLNRGVLITPFHNMMLVCPDTTEADVARLLDALDDVLAQLTGM